MDYQLPAEGSGHLGLREEGPVILRQELSSLFWPLWGYSVYEYHLEEQTEMECCYCHFHSGVVRVFAARDGAVFKGGGYGFKPPWNYNKKIFSLYKNYMIRNVWHLMLGQKSLKCREKPSDVYKMQQTTGAAGAPPRTPLGDLTAPQTP